MDLRRFEGASQQQKTNRWHMADAGRWQQRYHRQQHQQHGKFMLQLKKSLINIIYSIL